MCMFHKKNDKTPTATLIFRVFFRLLLVLQVLVIIICAYRILPILSCQCVPFTISALTIGMFLIQLICLAVCLLTKKKYYDKYQNTAAKCERLLD